MLKGISRMRHNWLLRTAVHSFLHSIVRLYNMYNHIEREFPNMIQAVYYVYLYTRATVLYMYDEYDIN